MKLISQSERQKNTAHTSLSNRQKVVPYLFSALLLLFLYVKPDPPGREYMLYGSQYLTVISLFSCIILAAALIGFSKNSPNNFLTSLACILAGHAILQLQLVIWGFIGPPPHITHNLTQLHFLVLPLFTAGGLFILAILDRFQEQLKSDHLDQIVFTTYGVFVVLFSVVLNMTFSTFSEQISSSLVFFCSLSSIFLSFFALALFPLKSEEDMYSLRYWTVFLILGNLSVYLTPTELLSGLTKINSVEVEFIRSGIFLALVGGLIFHSVSIIVKEQQRSRGLNLQKAANQLAQQGTILINKADNFQTAAKTCLNLIAEKQGYPLAHLILVQNTGFSHYWRSVNEEQFLSFKQVSQNPGIEFGEGFLGSLWEEQRFGIISDLKRAEDLEYRRKTVAREVGIRSIFAIPVFAGNRLIAMMEFFNVIPYHPDHAIISTINSFCHQLSNLYVRQQRTLALTERETLHQEVADKFPAAMAIFNSEEQLVFHNSLFTQMLGHLDIQIGRDFDFTDLVTAAGYSRKIIIDGGSPQKWIDEAVACYCQPVSAMIWRMPDDIRMELTCQRMQGERTICLWSDVSELLQSEERSQETQYFLDTVLETFPGGLCVFDRHMKIAQVNSKFIQMLGRADHDIHLGMSFAEFLRVFKDQQYQYGEFLTEMAQLRIKMAEGREPYHNGHLLFCQQTFNVFAAPTDDDGFTLSLMDVSDIENYQIALRDAKLRAEGKAERALEMARTAQSSNKVKTDFLALISREIRTPLTSITSAYDLLRLSKMTEEQSQHLKIVKTASEDLISLLDDIQDLASIEADKLALNVRPVQLGNLIDKINSRWSFLAKSKSLNFQINAAADIPDIFCIDQHRFEQIINNLVDNALKFTRSGEITVQMDADRADLKLKVSVADTGIGISKKAQQTLFRTLSENSVLEEPRPGSIGLGLTLCHDLVELMGGHIGVNSKRGEGSTFFFDIDYALPDENADVENLGVIETRTEDKWPADTPTMTILVAEDHQINQTVIQELLSRWGHKVEIVENGEMAVAAVATCKYDLVIMDIHMPVMDGVQATGQIRAFPGRIKDIPIIALTANAMSGERQRCLNAGMNDYLTKPIKKWELKDTLLTYSNMKRVGEDIWKQKVAIPADTAGESHFDLGTKVLDKHIFSEFIENFSSEVVLGLADKMFDQYEVHHTKILNFLQQNDWKGIGKECHMIKASFGQFGLMRAAAYATQMDIDAKNGNKQNVLDNAIAMLNLCDDAIILLRRELQGLPIE